MASVIHNIEKETFPSYLVVPSTRLAYWLLGEGEHGYVDQCPNCGCDMTTSKKCPFCEAFYEGCPGCGKPTHGEEFCSPECEKHCEWAAEEVAERYEPED